MPTINTFNMDCMELMRSKPDGYYDLAIVDPPYGGGGKADAFARGASRFWGRFVKYDMRCCRTGGTWTTKYQNDISPNPSNAGGENIHFWDYAPSSEYFDELFRVSKNQIVWGGNYFSLPPTRCFLIWRKTSISETFSMAMAEYAWTSFNDNAKVFECMPSGTSKYVRFHPTQKPIELYTWQMSLFCKPGMKLLDTHGGSFSSAIAAYRLGYDMDICEIQSGYYKKAKVRLDNEMREVNLF